MEARDCDKRKADSPLAAKTAIRLLNQRRASV
jgi:hypothetical protein